MDVDAEELIREVNQLVQRAQLGQAPEVLQAVERRLCELGDGTVEAGPAPMHYARVVTFMMLGDEPAGLAAVEHMILAAERDDAQGWRACALAMRAAQKIELGERDPARHDIDSVLADLAAAEAALDLSTDGGYVACRAHNAIANSYAPLRLYELAVPHQEAAYQINLSTSRAEDPTPSLGLLNLATLHLQWALELYRVGLDEEAEQHSARACEHATAAVDRLVGEARETWEAPCLLFQAAARSDGPDPEGAVEDLERLLPLVRGLGESHEHVLTVPYLAVALLRQGRREESLRVIEEALDEVREHESPTYLSLAHTQALLLAKEGSKGARAALAYGDALAAASWRQRQRTLDSAETMRAYAQLRAEHDQVTRVAETDALTGVANRRAFDRSLESLARTDDPDRQVGVLFIDLDEFKAINDTRGHVAGDTLLQGVARAIASNSREDDLVARIGGDEFAVLLPGAGTEVAEQAARRIISAVREVPGLPTVSIGGAAGPAYDVHATIQRADEAMYVAKRGGRDRHHVAPSSASPTPVA